MKKTPVLIPTALVRGLSGTPAEGGAKLLPQARLAGPMPWVIAIMIALTTVAAAGGLALKSLADAARAELSGGVTVQIVEANAPLRESQAALAVAILRSAPGVSSVRQVPKEEIDRLIEPWLGKAGSEEEAIPVPALIDVRLDGEVSPPRIAALEEALRTAAPAARVDAQASWLEPVFSAIGSLQWLALALILLLTAASVAAVWLAARTALGVNRETIEVVHHLGGTDSQIAAIFQRSVTLDATFGGIAGLSVGLITIFALASRFAGLDSGMVAGGGLGPVEWIVIACIPLAGIVLAAMTARLTVLAALRRML